MPRAVAVDWVWESSTIIEAAPPAAGLEMALLAFELAPATTLIAWAALVGLTCDVLVLFIVAR